MPHLFDEVLVNHLTGDTTDQFKVRRILDEQAIATIGGFGLLRAYSDGPARKLTAPDQRL